MFIKKEVAEKETPICVSIDSKCIIYTHSCASRSSVSTHFSCSSFLITPLGILKGFNFNSPQDKKSH